MVINPIYHKGSILARMLFLTSRDLDDPDRFGFLKQQNIDANKIFQYDTFNL